MDWGRLRNSAVLAATALAALAFPGAALAGSYFYDHIAQRQDADLDEFRYDEGLLRTTSIAPIVGFVPPEANEVSVRSAFFPLHRVTLTDLAGVTESLFDRGSDTSRLCNRISVDTVTCHGFFATSGTEFPFEESIQVGALADVVRLHGQTQNTAVAGGAGDDLLVGGRDITEPMPGEQADFTLLGGSGDDTLVGGPIGVDDLVGNDGDDLIRGGGATDFVDGGDGPDIVRVAGGGADHVDCGPGRDRAIVDATDATAHCERVAVD